MSFIQKFLKILITTNHKNLDNISKKIEATSEKTSELKTIQHGIYILQKQLVEQQHKLSSIINTATDSIIVLNKDGDIILWNNAAENVFQYTIDEMQSLGIGAIIDATAFNKYIIEMSNIENKCVRNKTVYINTPFLKKAIKKDGTIFPIEISVSSWKNNGDRYFTGIIRDLTEREEILKKIYTLEIINSLIITNAADGITVYDRDLNHVTWNPAMEKITKYKAQDILGKNVFDVFPGFKESEFADIFSMVLSGKETRSSLFLYTDIEGKTKYLKGKYSPLYDINKKNIIGIIGIIRIFPYDEIRTPELVQTMDPTGKTIKI